MTKLLATRDVYGETLAELGEVYKDIVVLDADLSAARGQGRTIINRSWVRG